MSESEDWYESLDRATNFFLRDFESDEFDLFVRDVDVSTSYGVYKLDVMRLDLEGEKPKAVFMGVKRFLDQGLKNHIYENLPSEKYDVKVTSLREVDSEPYPGSGNIYYEECDRWKFDSKTFREFSERLFDGDFFTVNGEEFESDNYERMNTLDF